MTTSIAPGTRVTLVVPKGADIPEEQREDVLASMFYSLATGAYLPGSTGVVEDIPADWKERADQGEGSVEHVSYFVLDSEPENAEGKREGHPCATFLLQPVTA